jgi:LPS export ABC transporter permease LptG/LPS export ABC transporter permease LptF
MLSIIDRYILRETLRMAFLGLLVFTFLLTLEPIMSVAEPLISKGVDGWTIARLMVLLIPQGLGVTIPMAVLIGLLMGLGRLSGDRETVALQACGLSLYRLLRPVALLGAAAMATTIYIVIVTLPDANQAYREIVFRTIATQAEDEVKPQVFYEGFSGIVLYVRNVDTQGTGWSDVFLADNTDPENTLVYIAKQGRVIIDRENRVVDIILTAGSWHRVDPEDPATYDTQTFEETAIRLDPDTVFPTGVPGRGLREMTISELQDQAASVRARGESPHNEIIEIHTKFSLPVACLVFAIIGLALGVTSRKDGKLASFALGIGVIFAYYIIMYSSRAMAKAAFVSPHLAMWLPNIILGAGGVALLVWRARSAGRRISLGRPVRQRLSTTSLPDDTPRDGPRVSAVAGQGTSVPTSARWAGGSLFSLLDRYVGKQYLRLVLLTFIGLLGIFYIATFVELSDKLFKGETTVITILQYFWYATPQFISYVLPISALVATLITVGMLTRSSELTVMKACGISLYRVSLPLLMFSLLWSGVLYGMSESLLAEANRRAEGIRHVINGNPTETFDLLDRRWLVSPDGSTIYHYVYFDPDQVELNAVTTYRFAGDDWRLAERTYATTAVFDDGWQGREVWIREFGDDGGPGAFESSDHSDMFWIDSPEYFATEQPDAERMSYQQLTRYINELEASGVDVVALQVALQRKLSFPFVTLILTLIAVPFAVTAGRHGAMYGVGVGIILAFSYWLVVCIFTAIGSAGLLTPLLAAWAPNFLFGGSAVYLLLAVRT